MSDVSEGLDVEITREFDAPRELVFRAFTEIELMMKWHGPRSHPVSWMDGEVREGGTWRSKFRSVETGEEMGLGGRWIEITPPSRIVWTSAWDGGPERRIIAEFEDLGDRTRMLFRHEGFDTETNRDGHAEGWASTFDRLDEVLAEIA